MHNQQEKKSQSSYMHIKNKIKVVFLGQQSTGKTSILSRFIHDKFEESIGPTVGIDFMAKNICISNITLRLQLWDTAGQERFRSLIPSYLKDASIALIVFDLTNSKSFQNMNQWVDLYHNNQKHKSVVAILGNKADLEESRDIEESTIRNKIEELGILYFEVSAKSGHNIKQAFNKVCAEYIKMHTNSLQNEVTLSQIDGIQTSKVVNDTMRVSDNNQPQPFHNEAQQNISISNNSNHKNAAKKKNKKCC